MYNTIHPQPTPDTGLLDLGFRAETFIVTPPVTRPTDADAEALVYGPTDKRAFEAFINTEDGRRAKAQMMRCVDTISRFAHDHGDALTARRIAHLNTVLNTGANDALQSHYLPELYAWGKRALEQIVAQLDRLADGGERREHVAMRHLHHLGEGIGENCGGRILQELTKAETGLGQIGGDLKNAVVRVCKNAADTVITQTLARGGADVIEYTASAHVQPQLARGIGLPWASAPNNDIFYTQPHDFQRRLRECRDAVRLAVTPALVAQTLGSECLQKAHAKLRQWAGETPDLNDADWPAMDKVLQKLGKKYGELNPYCFVRGDGVLAPRTLMDDPQAVTLNIRMNLVEEELVDKKDDVTLCREDIGDTRWQMELKQGDVPVVIEDDGDGPEERMPLTADFLRALLKTTSDDTPDAPCTDPLSDPKIRRMLIDRVVPALTTPPATWDTALLAVPGVLLEACLPLDDDAVAGLLCEIAARPDAAGTRLVALAFEVAVQQRVPAATAQLICAMSLTDLRAAWPRILPPLSDALLAANDRLADAGMAALDLLCPPADGVSWPDCRRALHGFRRGMTVWGKAPLTAPVPPWPDLALQRLGALNREGLLPGSTIVALLQGDMRLGVSLYNLGRLVDATFFRTFLVGLAQAGSALSLSRDDMRDLMRPIVRFPNAARDYEATSPLCCAVMLGQSAHVREFLSWMADHAAEPWMPPLQDLALPDEVIVLETRPPATVAEALKAYLDGLVTLHENGHLPAHALAPLIEVAADNASNRWPAGPGFELVRQALAKTADGGLGEAVLREWRQQAAPQLASSLSLVNGAAPDNAHRTLTPDAVAQAVPRNGAEPAIPRPYRLPAAQLQEATVYFGRQGYFSIEELAETLVWHLSLSDVPAHRLSKERCLHVIQQLSSDGVFSLNDCVAMLIAAEPSDDWRDKMLMGDQLSVLRAYFDLVEHLAIKHGSLVDAEHGGLVDVDKLLCLPTKDGNLVTLSLRFAHDVRFMGPSLDTALDFALKACHRGWITSRQLSRHLTAVPLRTGSSLLADMLHDAPGWYTDPEAPERNVDAYLRRWLDRLSEAQLLRALSGVEVVELLVATHGPTWMTPMCMAITDGCVRRLDLLFDWLLMSTATEGVLKRRLGHIVSGRNGVQGVQVAFEALRLGRVDTLRAWLAGIQRLREEGRLTNADYVTLLVPEGDGDRRAIGAVFRADPRAGMAQTRTLTCARMLRDAAVKGNSRGWIDADELQEILNPLRRAGLIKDQDARALRAAPPIR
ncbi:hypothetical protein [Mitsuaria sp. 7]|uniref:hypothetical protein n=1 Tax=Mitsuaria sp. 7 TaxID=1658665 RepID=UPI0007DD5931|nr:hypothetical protein [Mitsuaria sp. 7]ANH68686.1 hypothetical protein ABE85_15910 [Mitsuaria sp. 7]